VATPVIGYLLKLIWLFGTTVYIVTKTNYNSSLTTKISDRVSILQGSVCYWLNSEV